MSHCQRRLRTLTVIERLSADEQLMHIPLIIVSGCDVSLPQHRALAAAGYRFFAKGSSTPRVKSSNTLCWPKSAIFSGSRSSIEG